MSTFHEVSDRIGFGEGPVVLPDGRVAFCDFVSQSILIQDGERTSTLAVVPGTPNGLTLGPDSALYVANNGGLRHLPDGWVTGDLPDGLIQRVDLAGEVSTFIEVDGDGPHRLNDLVFDTDGLLYFTDSGNWEALHITREPDKYRGGALYLWAPEEPAMRLVEIADFPNGLAITDDGANLVVGQTNAQQILKFPIRDDGTVGEPTRFADLTQHGIRPDGLALAADGVLYAAGTSADVVAAISPDGTVARTFELPPDSMPTNVALAPGRLWVTLGRGGRLGCFEGDFEPA